MKKNILMISWFFPPLNSTASKRAGCFAKYLPKFGWQPVVICPDWGPDNCIYDREFVKNIPESVEVVTVPHEIKKTHSSFVSAASRVRNLVVPDLIPYDWWQNARLKLSDLFAKRKFSMIWSTSPDALQHALASWASRKWAVPWIADFRDVYGELKKVPIGDSLKYPIRLFNEKKRIKSAAEIVTVSDALAEVLAKRHRRNVHVIPNGFDPDDIADFSEQYIQKLPKFNIAYTGTLIFPQRNPRSVLEAINQLIKAGKVDKKDISIDFYGIDRRILGKFLAGYNDEHLIRVFGKVTSAECAKVQRSSAILLQLAHANEKGIMTGKIFEYLAAFRPILSIPSDNDCIDKLLTETTAGVSCTSVEEIATQVLIWYNEWKATGTIKSAANKNAILRYSRREQTKQLSELLNNL